MRSPVNWALLGLVIEQPTYAYDLAQRFERRYGEALQVSSIRHVYTALDALSERGLIEEVPGTRTGRQPRPHYRATERGAAEYEDWLVAQVCEDRHRRETFVISLSALAKQPQRLLSVLGRCEQAWLAAGASTPIDREAEQAETPQPFVRKLVDEDGRLAAGARLAWVQFARRELAKLMGRR